MTSENDIKRIREMMEFLVKEKISKILEKRNPKERQIYELTGIKKQNDIIKTLGVSSKKISKLWQDWEKEGILIKDGQKYKKVV